MTWTTPRTWADEELVTANLMNTHIRDNLNFLLNGHDVAALVSNTSGIGTTSTSYIDISLSYAAVTITPTSPRVLVVGSMLLSATNVSENYVYGRLYCTSEEACDPVFTGQNSTIYATLAHVFTGLTPGEEYTFSWQFKAVTGTVYAIQGTVGYPRMGCITALEI